MTCDRDDDSFPSPCCRIEVPPPIPRADAAARACEDVVLDLLTARPPPSDEEIVRRVHHARRLLREAAAAPAR